MEGKDSTKSIKGNTPHFNIFGLLNLIMLLELFSKRFPSEELTLSSGDFECHPREVHPLSSEGDLQRNFQHLYTIRANNAYLWRTQQCIQCDHCSVLPDDYFLPREIKEPLVELIATFPECLRRIFLVYWRALCFNKFGGCRAFWGSNLEGQNQTKPFLGF